MENKNNNPTGLDKPAIKFKKKHKLRKPSGDYTVGFTHLSYEYNINEKENKTRVVPCLCFYPAKDIGEGKLKKYVNDSIHPGTNGIETNSYIHAPISDGKYPLLLFNHGFSLFCEANTVQFEEFASHGFIVLSIGHPGGGSYELPNGQILMLDTEKMMKDFHADGKGMGIFSEYGEWINRDGKFASIQEHRNFYKSIIDCQPGFTAHSEIWIKDNLVALDMFLNEVKQENSILYNHVDEKSIGAFGMSYGGSTAINLTHASDLIKVSANLDGFYYSSTWQESIKKPIMLMQNDMGQLLTFPYLNAVNDAYLVTFKKSTHANFSDYNEIMAENYVAKGIVGGKEVEQPMLGKIDTNKMESIMNTLLLDFFNKYLRSQDSQVIDTDNGPNDVILLSKNLHNENT